MSRSCARGHSSAGLSGLSAKCLTSNGWERNRPSQPGFLEGTEDGCFISASFWQREAVSHWNYLAAPACERSFQTETVKLRGSYSPRRASIWHLGLSYGSGTPWFPELLGEGPWDPAILVIPDNSTEAYSSFQCP